MQQQVEIDVVEPTLVDDGSAFGPHTVYTVKTVNKRAFGSFWSAGAFEVTRRYKDFVWLDATLLELHPALVRPSLPSSHYWATLTGHSDDFIEVQ